MLLPYDPLLRLRLGETRVVARFGTLLVLTACCAGATAANQGGWWGWTAGLVTAAVVLGAQLLHLWVRLLAVRRLGSWPMRSHLTVFGWVPDPLDDAENPRSEALIGIAGLLAIVAVAAVAAAIDALVGDGAGRIAEPVHAAAVALAGLAVVQAMPGLPLDGGRIFRGLVWYLTDNPTAGARAAAAYAQLVAAGLVVFGVVAFAFAGPLPYWGLWALVGGWQLGGEARAGLFRLRWQRLARTTPVGDLVISSQSLPGGSTIDAALDPLIEAGGDVPFLVVDVEKRPIGVLRVANLRVCPRTEWSHRTAAEVAAPLAELPRVDAGRPAREALALLDDLEARGTELPGGPVVVVTKGGIPVAALDRRRILLGLLAAERAEAADRLDPTTSTG